MLPLDAFSRGRGGCGGGVVMSSATVEVTASGLGGMGACALFGGMAAGSGMQAPAPAMAAQQQQEHCAGGQPCTRHGSAPLPQQTWAPPPTTRHAAAPSLWPTRSAAAGAAAAEASASAAAVAAPAPGPAGSAAAAVGTGPRVSDLLVSVKALRAVALTTDAANGLLGQQLRHLTPQHELSSLLVRNFPWDPQTRAFVNTNAAPGCCDALDLVKLVYVLQQYLYQRMPGELGSGSYSVVIGAVNRDTGERVALKKLKYSSQDVGFEKSVVREVGMLRELSHENIIRLRDVMTTMTGRSVYLVLECMECNLRTYLDNAAPDVATIKVIMYQILNGMAYMHARSIMHRDIKPQNVLVSGQQLSVKLSDFGLARHYMPFGQQYTSKVITLYYRAPELLLGQERYSCAVDLWSAGCVLAEMLNGEPLFLADTELGLLGRLMECRGCPSEAEYPAFHAARLSMGMPAQQQQAPKLLGQLVPALAGDADGVDLLGRLLAWNPDHRISAREALKHPWFGAGRGGDDMHMG